VPNKLKIGHLTKLFNLPRPYLCLFIIISTLILSPWLQPTRAQQIFQTPRTLIYYENPADLQEMEAKLSSLPMEGFGQRDDRTLDPVQTTIYSRLSAKIEGLLTKICIILNKRPKSSDSLKILLLNDGNQVRQRLLAIQTPQRPTIFGHETLCGFYEPISRTIFLSLADLRPGILAHEMAHFVLCQAFSVPPAAELQEPWAQYVEVNIDRTMAP